jgi:hypothetical protein
MNTKSTTHPWLDDYTVAPVHDVCVPAGYVGATVVNEDQRGGTVLVPISDVPLLVDEIHNSLGGPQQVAKYMCTMVKGIDKEVGYDLDAAYLALAFALRHPNRRKREALRKRYNKVKRDFGAVYILIQFSGPHIKAFIGQPKDGSKEVVQC